MADRDIMACELPTATERMSAAIAAEYQAVTVEATTSRHSDAVTRRRVVVRLRRELHRIQARDFFEPEQRAAATPIRTRSR